MLYLREHSLSCNGELNDSKSTQHFLSHPDHLLEDVNHPPRCSAYESQLAAVNCSQGEEVSGFSQTLDSKVPQIQQADTLWPNERQSVPTK